MPVRASGLASGSGAELVSVTRAEPCLAQPFQGRQHVPRGPGMPSVRALQLGRVRVGDRHAADRARHAQDPGPERAEGQVAARQGGRLRMEHQLGEPVAHHGAVAEQAQEQRLQMADVEQGLVDVEDQDGGLGHGGGSDRPRAEASVAEAMPVEGQLLAEGEALQVVRR